MKRNFQFEKRKKDLDKKQKREEKQRKKLERRNQGEAASSELPPDGGPEPDASGASDPMAG